MNTPNLIPFHVELRAKTFDQPLYHYTTQAGLIGILRDRAVRATSIWHLNDSREFALARDLMVAELDRREREGTPEDRRHAAGTKRILTDESLPIPAYVFSLSEDGDLLSQRRAYGGSAGFSLGFTVETVRNRLGRFGRVLPCVYHEAEHKRLVNEFLDAALWQAETIAMQQEGDPSENPTQRMFVIQFVAQTAAMIKDAAFKEEREWRVVVADYPENPHPRHLREGDTMPLPYINLPLTENRTAATSSDAPKCAARGRARFVG